MGSKPQKQKPMKVPRYYDQRNSNELKFIYAPSFRPTEGSLNEGLPSTSDFYMHGLYPSYHRHEVKDLNGEVQMKGKVLNIQTTKDHDIAIPYIGPDEAVAEELRRFWKSMNCDFSDEDLWIHEWNKHAKYHDLGSDRAYWAIAVEAARPYLDQKSTKCFKNLFGEYISGHEYSCLELQDQFDLLVGRKVDVLFRRRDSKLYLSEVSVLFNSAMEVIDHVQPNKQKDNIMFLFEDWCGRFNLPREGGETAAGKQKASDGKQKRKRTKSRSFLMLKHQRVGRGLLGKKNRKASIGEQKRKKARKG